MVPSMWLAGGVYGRLYSPTRHSHFVQERGGKGWGEGGHEMKIKYSGRGIKIKMPLHTLLAWYMVNLTIISSKFEQISPYC